MKKGAWLGGEQIPPVLKTEVAVEIDAYSRYIEERRSALKARGVREFFEAWQGTEEEAWAIYNDMDMDRKPAAFSRDAEELKKVKDVLVRVTGAGERGVNRLIGLRGNNVEDAMRG